MKSLYRKILTGSGLYEIWRATEGLRNFQMIDLTGCVRECSILRSASWAGVVWMALWLALAPLSGRAEPAPSWKERLTQLPGGAGCQSSACLFNESGQVVEQWDCDRLMVPASTLKIATAATIIEKQGLNQVLSTRLQVMGQRVRWVGDYDPELTSGDLENLALALLPQLPPKVMLEVPPAELDPYAPGWSWDDLSSSFAPPVAPLVFDHGLVPLRLQSRPEGGLQVAGPPWSPQGALSFLPQAGEFELRLFPGWEGWVMCGQVPPGVEEAATVPMVHPELAAARLLQEVWQRKGRVVEVGAPSLQPFAAEKEASHSSRPVQQILAQGLADSDNLVLECLYRRFGRSQPSCWQDQTLRVVDGSGLSRYNLVSTRQLAQVLRSACSPLSLLPVAGREGTMRRRFVGTLLENQMRAKTGTMSGVSGLVGEFSARSGHHYCFALLIGGFVGKAQPFKQAEEEIVLDWVRRL